ncbi:hypothetical protein [Thalassospira alkalitolerans]|uniref:hypothetical protein n=1 Tax=Thalassospira alkalitolerans TaxID=1293890 RepID=UPI003AA8B776
MRILGLAVIVFLIAAVLVVARFSDGIVQNLSDVLPTPTQMEFEVDAPEIDAKSTRYKFLATDRDSPFLLSGFGSYQALQFILPTDSRAISGQLELNITVQAHQDAIGTLKVQIDGERRAEILIPSDGIHERSVILPLTLEDLAAPSLTVSLSMQGDVGNGLCRLRDQAGAVIEIEQTSGLVLDLDQPLQSVRDRLASWGNTARMEWTDDVDALTRAQSISEMARLLSLGQPARFDDSDEVPLLTLEDVAWLADQLSNDVQETWPVDLSTQPNNIGLRRFGDSTQWRYRYQLNNETSPPIPTHLDYNIYLGPTLESGEWIVAVTLNNKILDIKSYPSGPQHVREQIDLPAEYHLSNNLLQIEAHTTGSAGNTALCDQEPFQIAELLTGTTIKGDGGPFKSGLTSLRRLISDSATIVNASHLTQLSAADAYHATQLLSALSPVFKEDARNAPPIEIEIVPAGLEIAQANSNQSNWIIGRDNFGEIIAERLDSLQAGTSQHELRLMVHIPPRIETSSEEVKSE